MRIKLRPEYLNIRHPKTPKRSQYISYEDMLDDTLTKSRMREVAIFRCHDASRHRE